MLESLHRLNDMRKEHGLARTISNLGNYIKNNYLKIYLESYYVFEKDLDGNMEIEKPRIDLDVVRINKYNYMEYIDYLIRFWPDFFRFNRNNGKLRKDIDYYFQCDDECFLAMHDGEIAAMIWCGYQKNHMLQTVGKKIGLREDEAIIHRVYVHDKFRGNHIYPFLHTHIYKYLHVNKINKVTGGSLAGCADEIKSNKNNE